MSFKSPQDLTCLPDSESRLARSNQPIFFPRLFIFFPDLQDLAYFYFVLAYFYFLFLFLFLISCFSSLSSSSITLLLSLAVKLSLTELPPLDCDSSSEPCHYYVCLILFHFALNQSICLSY